MITETMLGLDHMSFNSLDTMTVKDVMQTEVATIDDPYDLENVLHLLSKMVTLLASSPVVKL